ncbi:Sporulation protein RMD1 [Auxenochlorella protothecoides]|uniref:Sporulation protein RMD1 n=1 Tax=Auxenochlorella protothecoides TaxID=3075 RepID=A0A087SNN2_AUXPR|nr:Sporulation protein RMD1 [Auxenochlorella protothecoides]KFM27336.1 Sporulation protein RMD1 [Auxenochlorella protothecoides]
MSAPGEEVLLAVETVEEEKVEAETRTVDHQRSRSVPSVRELRRLPSSTSTVRPLGRIVSLGPGWESPLDVEKPVEAPPEVPVQYQGLGQAVRVRSYCVANGFDRYALQDAILRRNATLRAYSDVLCIQYHRGGKGKGNADIFFFDSGVVVFWGLDTDAEKYILNELVMPCVDRPLPPDRIERDRVLVTYSAVTKAVIEDDTISLHYRHADELYVKLAISFALAESTKLSVFEEDLRSLGRSVSYLPAMMADKGEIDVGGRAVMQLMGQLFLQQRSVNLLTQLLDAPSALDEADDHICTLYRSIFDYMEVVQRVTLLNDRFGVMKEMLDILRQQAHDSYFGVLEATVIWLVGVCSFLAFCQLLAVVYGWEGGHAKH